MRKKKKQKEISAIDQAEIRAMVGLVKGWPIVLKNGVPKTFRKIRMSKCPNLQY